MSWTSLNLFGGVTRLLAGSNITINPSPGFGVVTVNASGGGGGGAVASVSGSGTGISVSPTTGAVVVSNTQPASTFSTHPATSTLNLANFEIQNIQGLRGSVAAASLPIVAALGKNINLLPDNGTGVGFVNMFGRVAMNAKKIILKDETDSNNYVEFSSNNNGAAVAGYDGVALYTTNTGTPVPSLVTDNFANVYIFNKLFRQILGTSNFVDSPIIQHGQVVVTANPTRFDFAFNGYHDFASPPNIQLTLQSVSGTDTVTVNNVSATGFDVYCSILGRPVYWLATGQ